MSHAEQILRAAAALTARGHTEFSRQDIRTELGLSQRQWMSGYTAIVQAMREDPGRAPSVGRNFRRVFRHVRRGQFALTELGKSRVRELSARGESVPRRGTRPETPVAPSDRVGTRQVILYPGEDGYWIAECPSLPGCISQGKTKPDAIHNIREAIEGYVAALADDKLPIPEERFEALLIAV